MLKAYGLRFRAQDQRCKLEGLGEGTMERLRGYG